jgi:RNA polymerase sigma factor (sigma-70 family)
MSEKDVFHELMRRVRSGDSAAALELVSRFEPVVRRAVRSRLRDSALRREFDSMDVCQSVLGNFFVRVAAGQFELGQPGQLVALLVTMARNKLATQARRPHFTRRLDGNPTASTSAENDVADPGPSPSRHAEHRDLLHEVLRRLSEAERRLAEERARGRSWDEIAAAVGGNPDALRKQLTRALDRVTQELNLNDTATD